MRRSLKKISSAVAVSVLSAALMFGSSFSVWAGDETTAEETTEEAVEETTEEQSASDDSTASTTSSMTVEDQAKMYGEYLTQSIIASTDEQIAQYLQVDDEFTQEAFTAWDSTRNEIGELKSEELTTSAAINDDGNYEITVDADYSKGTVEFVYVFDSSLTSAISASINVNYPLSENLKRAGLNTLMGIGTVFLVLVFLSFLISLFKYIPTPEKKKAEEAKLRALAPAPAPAAAAPVVEEEVDDTELIAVIAAAIAASEGTTTDGFVVRSIRKINKKRR